MKEIVMEYFLWDCLTYSAGVKSRIQKQEKSFQPLVINDDPGSNAQMHTKPSKVSRKNINVKQEQMVTTGETEMKIIQ